MFAVCCTVAKKQGQLSSQRETVRDGLLFDFEGPVRGFPAQSFICGQRRQKSRLPEFWKLRKLCTAPDSIRSGNATILYNTTL